MTIEHKRLLQLTEGWENVYGSALTYFMPTKNCTHLVYYDDDIHSLYECKRRARQHLHDLYDPVADAFDPNGEKRISREIAKEYFDGYKRDLPEITSILKSIDNKFLADEISDMLTMLVPAALRQRIESLLDEELEGAGMHNMYGFRPFEDYYDEIEYEDMEHDPPGLFGKCDWWFDGNSVWLDICNELGEKTERFHDRAKEIMDSEIAAPLKRLAERIGRCEQSA